ncbi:MAG: hypothetical protein AB1509_14410 [Chloroflexota bacterium]
MNPWLDGLTVLANEWRLTVPILLCAFASQALIGLFLQAIFGDRLAASERLALALGGWTIPLLLLSLLWYFSGWDGLFWILPAALLLLLLFRLRTDLKPALHIPSLFLLLFFFLSLLLRLAYASRTDLPLYFDSAQHYLIIKTLLLKSQTLMWGWLSASYYHFGFHFLAAFFAEATDAEIARVMLIFGQIILLLIPLPVFFIVRHETNSDAAGGFALLLAAFGWYMPAHAVNWGKYPALMSVGMFAWLWGMMLIVFRQQDGFSSTKRRALYALWAGGAALTVLTHTRSLILLGIVLFASAIAAWLERRSRKWMHAALFAAAVAVALLGWLASRESLLAMTFDSYLERDLPPTLLVFLLCIPAGMIYPRLTLISVLTTAGLLASLFLPVTFVPAYEYSTLLDRPFVEMILFLPLSVLGGLGLAGLERRLQGRLLWRRVLVLLAAGLVMVRAVFGYDLYPSQCCMIVGRDDLAAMDWMAKRLPLDARITIAAGELKVTVSENSAGYAGTDAGVWITPLTGRETLLYPLHWNFDHAQLFDFLCREKVRYIFVGETGLSFDRDGFNARPQWYRPLLSMPKTAVYEVTGCE